MAKLVVALSLALSFSAVKAANLAGSDDSLADSVKAALHNRLDSDGRAIRVQAIDGTVYLYGTVDTYAERASIDEAADAAAHGHVVVDSIGFDPS
jgi:osmotically-inducible protein OsmY